MYLLEIVPGVLNKFWVLKGGIYLREALIKQIKKHQNTFKLSLLIKQYIKTVIIAEE